METDPAPEPGRGTANLVLTREEADALLQLIDMALKAGGLAVAQAAVHLASRVIVAREQPVGPGGEANLKTESR